MSSNDTQPKFDLMPLAAIVRKRVFWLIGFAALGAVIAFFYSMAVTPLFESHVIMYPSNSNSRDKQLEDLSFGHEVHAERLMQLLQSSALLDSLEARYQLSAHWEIDKSRPDWYDALVEIAKDRITFHKNKYVSVTISVVDPDPEFCAKIANASAKMVNEINAQIVREAARASLEVVEKEYIRRQLQVRNLNDSISNLENSTMVRAEGKLSTQAEYHRRRMRTLNDSLDLLRNTYGIHDLGTQITSLNEHLIDAQASLLQEEGILASLRQRPALNDSLILRHEGLEQGARNRVERFTKEIERLNGASRRFYAIKAQLEQESELLLNTEKAKLEMPLSPQNMLQTTSFQRIEDQFRWDQLQTQELQEKYQRALGNYLEPVPAAIVVSAGRASHRKVYPHTLANIAVGALGFLAAALVAFTILDRRRVGATA